MAIAAEDALKVANEELEQKSEESHRMRFEGGERMENRMFKKFEDLSGALKGLLDVSHSAAQSLHHAVFGRHGWGDTEEAIEKISSASFEEIVAGLTRNVEECPEWQPRCPSVLKESETNVLYQTSGGLSFEIDMSGDGVEVVVYHPGSHSPRMGEGKSSLKASCLKNGFDTVNEV